MKEQLISFETAKLAKEKGFDWCCLNYWGINHIAKLKPELNSSFNRHTNNYNGSQFRDQCYSAPTQSLLQKWLREKHMIILEIVFNPSFGSYIFKLQNVHFSETSINRYDTYEVALGKGLYEALKLIR